MDQNINNLYVIILAAGESSRFGSPKQLAHWQNTNLLQHTINLAISLVNENVIVVLGANANQIEHSINKKDFSIVINSNWQKGLSSSIKAGVVALPDTADAVLILLCDQPSLETSSIEKLITLWQQQPESIIASEYNNTAGVPAIFPSSMFSQLKTLSGDKGAKQLLKTLKDKVLTVPLPEASQDIDTAEDFEHFKLQYNN